MERVFRKHLSLFHLYIIRCHFPKQLPLILKSVQLAYKRLPAFTEVKRNDVVVFNFPAGDTIINLPEYGSAGLL